MPLRIVGYTTTAAVLTDPIHFQSLSSCARSIHELCVDVEFLLCEPPLIEHAVRKYHAFTRVSRFLAARRLLAFYDEHPEYEQNTANIRAFVGTVGLDAEITGLRKELWPTAARGLKHWTGLDLAKRSQLAGPLYEDNHRRFNHLLNWHIHSGAAGTGGLAEDSLRAVEILARQMIRTFVPTAFRKIGVALHLHRVISNFASTLDDLVSKVEADTYLRQRAEDVRP